MNKAAGKQGAVPRLRFPGFEGEWKEVALSTQIDLTSGQHLAPDAYADEGEIPYFTGSSDYSNSLASVGKWALRSANTGRSGDTLITVKGNGVGELLHLALKEVAMGCQLMAVRPRNAEGGFLFQFLATQRNRFNALASGNLIPGLSRGDILGLSISVPLRSEQKKIADCLSSLDACIGAETRTLDALKTHKQGLMQQLFPGEGQCLPRLRFPGFEGEWEVYDLGRKTVKVGSGVTPTGGQQVYKASGRPFVRSQNVGWGELLLDDVAFIDDETHASFPSTELADQDVLLNITGASIGRSAIADSRVAGGNVNQHVCIIRPIAGSLSPVFLNQFLISQLGQNQIDSFQAGGNRQGLNFAQIRSLNISLPPTFAEQQEISACLFSIDTLIAMQSRKIATLQQHKKGLLQGLFPTLDAQTA